MSPSYSHLSQLGSVEVRKSKYCSKYSSRVLDLSLDRVFKSVLMHSKPYLYVKFKSKMVDD